MRKWMSRFLALILLMRGLAAVALDHASAAGDCQWKGSWVRGVGAGTLEYGRTWDCPAGETPSSASPAGAG
jgi:hypothetical protein